MNGDPPVTNYTHTLKCNFLGMWTYTQPNPVHFMNPMFTHKNITLKNQKKNTISCREVGRNMKIAVSGFLKGLPQK